MCSLRTNPTRVHSLIFNHLIYASTKKVQQKIRNNFSLSRALMCREMMPFDFDVMTPFIVKKNGVIYILSMDAKFEVFWW